ncbi:MAG: CoA transferase [Gammaproteobacteria bacterium]|nr:CoA transferase [Gammaproteobacteria bacterium]GIT27359.1 MAG: CoA transferase [Gammaproteobacteria bacterium]
MSDGLLSDLTVVELGHSVAAPFGGQTLAILGARVIKVENPENGDDARTWGPPFWEGASSCFQSLNREKLSVTVDFKNDHELAGLKDFIVSDADLVIQNQRPGLLKRFGLDGDSLRKSKPSLIYCNIGAFGAAGPLSEKPGYDPLMQAFSGIMSITGEEGREPVRVGPSIIDMAAGMWCCIGLLSALHRRNQTGEGCEIDTSLYETALAWMTVPSAIYLSSDKVPARTGSEAPMLVPYKVYRAADDYLVIAAGNDNLFGRLCDVLGVPEWKTDVRFSSNPVRVKNRKTLNDSIQGLIETDTRDSWIKKLDDGGVPNTPLQTVDQVLQHPQTAALGMLQNSPNGKMSLMGVPLSFDGERPGFLRDPPELGQHTTTILKEATDDLND